MAIVFTEVYIYLYGILKNCDITRRNECDLERITNTIYDISKNRKIVF